MRKYLILGVVGLIAIALVVFYLPPKPDPTPQPAPPGDPLAQQLALLAENAERTCLVGADTRTSAAVSSQIELIKGVRASANVERREQALKGAIDFPEKLKAPEMAAARACLEPWAEQMRRLAEVAMQKPG